MNFPVVDNAIETCKRCLAHFPEDDILHCEIAAYLVGYLLVRMYGCFETSVRAMYRTRVTRSSDPHLRTFLWEAAKRGTGRIKVGDLNDLLRKFGDDYRDSFRELVDTAQIQPAWDTIVINRNDLAHGGDVKLTLRELEEAYPKCLELIDAFGEALQLTVDEKTTLG